MTDKYSICVCGGGNIGHAIAAYVAHKGVDVTVYTRRPSDWCRTISAILPDGRGISGNIVDVSDNPSLVANAAIVFITVPKFGVSEILENIEPFLSRGQALVAIPGGAGFDWMTRNLLSRGVDILGLQRVPFIARTKSYGKSVHIQGFKKELKIAALPSNAFGRYQYAIEDIFDTPVKEVSSFLAIALNNSNPLLHPARFTTMFSDWEAGVVYKQNSFFYEEWDDRASEALICADAELMKICKLIPDVLMDVVPICEYYQVAGVTGMTEKIRSIPAFKGIEVPMIMRGLGWVPDLSSRYFSEDIPYGTVPIKAIAELANVKTPTIDGFIEWVQRHSGKNIIENGSLINDGCVGLPVPKNYGLFSFHSLISRDYT